MKKLITTVSAGLLLGLMAKGQTTNLNHTWENEYAPSTLTNTSVGQCVATDGNMVYAAGKFSGTVDFDGAGPHLPLTATGTSDMYITCTNGASGALVWKRQIGGAGSGVELPRRMIVSGTNLFLVGNFSSSCDFNLAGAPAPAVSAGGDDMFILNYNTSGTYLSVFTTGSTGPDQAYGVAQDPVGGSLIVSGTFSGTVDFDPVGITTRTVSSADSDGFIACYSAGGLCWVTQIGSGDAGAVSTGTENVSNVRIFGTRIFVTGYLNTALCDFNPVLLPAPGAFPTVTTWGSREIFVAAYNLSTGGYIWHKTIGGSLLDTSADLAVDNTGRIYLVANVKSSPVNYSGSASTLTPWGWSYDFIIASIDGVTGNLGWWQWLGGSAGDDVVTTIEHDGTDIYVGGYYLGAPFDFDYFNVTGTLPAPGTSAWTNAGAQDMFLARFRPSNGYCTDAAGMGGTGNDRVLDIAVDISSSKLYSTGTFQNTCDADPQAGVFNLVSTSGAGLDNAFVASYDYSGVLAMMLAPETEVLNENTNEQTITTEALSDGMTVEEAVLSVYPNPTNGTVYVDNMTVGNVISLYNMDGSIAGTWTATTDGRMTLDLSDVSNGMYIVSVKMADGAVMISKVSKQ